VVWLQSVLLFVHILGAIFWFGSGLFLQFVIVPAVVGMPFEAQKSFLVTLAARYGKIIGPVAGVTILFGLGRGIAVGVLGNLGTAYGLTFLVSIVAAVAVSVIGARFIGPTAAKMAEANTRDEVVRLAGQIRGYGRFDTGGMLLLVGLMVAMRAGY
jgi:uncharacterized membrane protein